MRTTLNFAFVAVCIALPAFGNTIAFSAPGNLTDSFGAPVNLGMVFTANSTFSIDALGFYDMAGVAPETVAVYDSSDTLLTSISVSLSDPIVDGYFYQSISPITLLSGAQYTVVEFSSNGVWSWGGAPTTSADITFNYHDYDYASGLAFPTTTLSAAGSAYYGPNFWIASTSVPEPSTMVSLVPSLLALLGVAARRSR